MTDDSTPQEPTPEGSANPPAWPVRGRQPGPDLSIFQVRHDDLENPRTGKVMRRVVLETPDWVNVIARTVDHEIVVVRQYRFGIQDITAEIPGGMIDPGEDPLVAAQRELREETGYESDQWRALGNVQPNPAFHDNLCYHFLADHAVPVGPPNLDAGEDIRVETWPLTRMLGAVESGEVRHTLVLSALACLYDLSGIGRPTK